MTIIDEFLEWIEKLRIFAERFKTSMEKDAFYQGALIGLLLNDIDIEVKEKVPTGED